jgi:Spy/CpxP family protein refolding chaperone
MTVGGALETALLPGLQAVLAHQPGCPPPTDGKAFILEFTRHARAAIGAMRGRERRTDRRQENEILLLAPTGGAATPGEIAARADAEHIAHALNREFLFRHIDELELHRLPSLAKKAVAFFRMSRS